ncbi:MAG: glycogen debranching enzyme GlgX [Nevskia sp.]|nr:glycogen debranching enzyme GlgX [Nevskia sp.]
MSQFPQRLDPGSPYPLGASFDGNGTNFAVFSENAGRLQLCLFDDSGKHETRFELPECTNGIWHGYLPNARPGQQYGYRAYGPYQPEDGHRFNPHKLLFDPYARKIAGEVKWSDALHGYRLVSPKADLSLDRRDSAFAMPKGVVTDEHFDWGDDRPPRVPWSDTLIYEVHLRGLTKLRTDLPEKDRGTFSALGHVRTVEYLKSLGITTVELLPIHAFVNDRRLVEAGLSNYWGYNTLGFFAPESRYLSDGTLGQMKWAVKQLHAAGLEVILDVVYNHTCEGSELGTTMSFRGLDNASYYRLMPDEPRYCINDTGCGNTVNLTHPRVIQLVMDSLRYWVQEFHVDGFRFDLGVTLGRELTGFDPGAGFFDALMQDPVLSRVKLISEPWDIGMGGYQIGNHPAGMGEWNGKYRDEVRKFWKGDAGMRGALAARLQGSADMFDHHKRRPWASVNFITAHDGFTLRDLVSYNDKHNEDNGEDNKDGGNDNESNNWGIEGPTDDVAINATRERVQRSQLATLLFSHGTPMLLGGDEFGRTQNGNNNAYCHDNELAWFDWTQIESEAGQALRAYLARLIAIRRQHASLRGLSFMHGREEIAPGLFDVEWFDESGDAMDDDRWGYYEGRLLALRRLTRDQHNRVEATLLLVNNSGDDREFVLPQPLMPWRLLLDSAQLQTVERGIGEDERINVVAHGVMLLAVRNLEPQA